MKIRSCFIITRFFVLATSVFFYTSNRYQVSVLRMLQERKKMLDCRDLQRPPTDRPTDRCKNCIDRTDRKGKGAHFYNLFNFSTVCTVCTIFTMVCGTVCRWSLEVCSLALSRIVSVRNMYRIPFLWPEVEYQLVRKKVA